MLGTANISDHNAIYLTVNLDDMNKSTFWRLSVGLLNKATTVNEIKK